MRLRDWFVRWRFWCSWFCFHWWFIGIFGVESWLDTVWESVTRCYWAIIWKLSTYLICAIVNYGINTSFVSFGCNSWCSQDSSYCSNVTLVHTSKQSRITWHLDLVSLYTVAIC
jgi:hypothetical protein